MTKVELIASVAAEAGMSKKDAEKAVNAALAAITEELKNGGKVSLVGFGTFEVRERPERQGRNPQKLGKECDTPAYTQDRTTKYGLTKGWDTQGVDRFYFDPITGAMAKGVVRSA